MDGLVDAKGGSEFEERRECVGVGPQREGEHLGEQMQGLVGMAFHQTVVCEGVA